MGQHSEAFFNTLGSEIYRVLYIIKKCTYKIFFGPLYCVYNNIGSSVCDNFSYCNKDHVGLSNIYTLRIESAHMYRYGYVHFPSIHVLSTILIVYV